MMNSIQQFYQHCLLKFALMVVDPSFLRFWIGLIAWRFAKLYPTFAKSFILFGKITPEQKFAFSRM